MPCVRHIIVCEGKSEWAYLQRLQSFFDDQPLADGTFEAALRMIAPERAVAKTGTFGKLKSRYVKTRQDNKNASIEIWADFDLYHRNDKKCADLYKAKPVGIPDFVFSYHNFEDFIALHLNPEQLGLWLTFGQKGHFTQPLHSVEYLPEFRNIFPGYGKGAVPVEFISWDSLKNLKANLHHQPTSNPRNLQGIRSFAEFLIHEIEQAYPGQLD